MAISADRNPDPRQRMLLGHKCFNRLVACAALLLTACQQNVPASAPLADGGRHYGQLAFRPCTLSSQVTPGNVEAKCANLEVPENPALPDGRKITLNIAWLEAGDQNGGEIDPVFFIAGGPGQAATEVADIVSFSLREVRKQRDIFLLDQRGTGKSNPLTCTDEKGQPLVLEEKPGIESETQLVDYARACAESLKGRADPRFYTSTEAIADLDAVRAALGADKINLVGVSYGTRVVQQYVAQYSQHVRTIVMDGVTPNDLVAGGEFAMTLEDALRLQSKQCQSQPGCQARFPTDMREQLRNVMAQLRQMPVEVAYRDPGTAETRRDEMTADTIISLAFAFSYLPQTAALLPLVLDEAAQGRYSPLMSLAQLMNRQLGGQINRTMQWSVICAEDADRYMPAPEAQNTILGSEVARLFFAPCKVWPAGTRPAGFTELLRSDVPALLLSGELDPVTPPRYAEKVLGGLSQARHLIAKGQGHGAISAGCMPKLLAQFIETQNATSLKTQCLDSLTFVPPFTTFNGWEP